MMMMIAYTRIWIRGCLSVLSDCCGIKEGVCKGAACNLTLRLVGINQLTKNYCVDHNTDYIYCNKTTMFQE